MARRKTESLVRVAIALMSDPSGRHYGYGLSTASGVRSGVLYPMLDRMLEDGWVTAEWDLPDESSSGRPRRYYTLTDRGRHQLGALASSAPVDLSAVAVEWSV